MHYLYRRCILSPLPSGEMELRYPFVYKDVEIPKGFVFTPVLDKILPAQLVYEYLFSIEKYEDAGRYLEEITEILEIGELSKGLNEKKCERILDDALKKAFRICKRVENFLKKEIEWGQ